MAIKFTKNSFYSLIVYIGVFLYGIYPYGDFDWGWHYRYGEYLVKFGQILRTNLFTWTLPNFAWVNISWLYDPVLYIVYSKAGFAGLSIAGGLLIVLVFYVIFKPFNLIYWQKAVLAVPYLLLMSFGADEGLRSLMFGFLFLALTMSILKWGEKKFTLNWFLVPVFLLWANMHGSFIIGPAVLGIYFITHYKNLRLIPVFGVSVLATLINPFTYHIYPEVLIYQGNPILKNIFDWHSVNIFACTKTGCFEFAGFSLIMVIGTLLVLIYQRKLIQPFYLLSGLFFFYLAVSAQRNMPLFLIATLPFVAILLSKYSLPKKLIQPVEIIFLIAFSFFAIKGIVRLESFNLNKYGFNQYCSQIGCSEGSIEYLIKNPPVGKGFNYYDWGGYWIGRGVPAKVFGDGRMTVWKDHGVSPFYDYVDIYFNGNSQKFIDYDFKWVYIETNSKLNDVLLNYQSINKIGKWVSRYSDSVASYWVRVE